MVRTPRSKLCSQCSQEAAVLYRSQIDTSWQWRFICVACFPQVSQNNPCYRYGGTWKAEKKR
ncbi:MAG: hypothetical protein KME15_00895 [Drouetiella hepatica Uher 2000/2452]|jgi:rRNA maturation endonuclease Nob1|uniref:Uncharacterized protein n=1 Tax=Drouetiella hepatica Uher 2000/2452 TaxID=904376 RepID=A0A951Q6V3_9CYAN|nr:hypothetical protein [Drouetiella hepatica Uher 2000/2452]